MEDPNKIYESRSLRRHGGSGPQINETNGATLLHSNASEKQTAKPTAKPTRPTYEAHSELPPVPKESQLGWLSTTALILNKIIGTGVYNSPKVVLTATRSKFLSLMIWTIGCLMTWGGLMMYLEYGIKWPKTGGELYYVDYIFKLPDREESPRRKNLRRILTYIYASIFVLVSGLQANSLVFGLEIILANSPDATKVNYTLQKFIAIVVITLVSIIKVLFLIFISICGFVAFHGVRSGAGQKEVPTTYGTQNLPFDIASRSDNPFEYSLALLSVMRAFFGYENANFVLGEVRKGPAGNEKRIFVNAVICSVVTSCVLYLLVNVAFFAVLTTDEIINAPYTLPLFFQKIFGNYDASMRVSAVMISFSAGGSLIGLTFAYSRVKQEIGRLGFLPVPEYWAATSLRRTPSHALFLHWIFSVVCIFITPLSNPAGYLIMSNIYAYMHTYVGPLLGCALLCASWLPSFQYDENGRSPWEPQSSPLGWWLLAPLTVIYVLCNVFVLVVSWFPASLGVALGTTQPTLPYYTGPVAGLCVIGFGILWWAWDTYIAQAFGYLFWTTENPAHVSQKFGSPVTLITYYRDVIPGSVAEKVCMLLSKLYKKLKQIYELVRSKID